MAIEKARWTPGLRLPGWFAATILVALVIVAGGVGALLMSQLAGQNYNFQFPGITTPAVADTVTVVGEGRVAATPDTIFTDVGAEAQATSLSLALNAAASDGDKLTAALKNAGIAPADMQTTSLYAYVRTDQYGNVVGYNASTYLRVRIRDVSKATSILNAAAGAIGPDVRLGTLQYQRTDIAAQAAQARQLALAAAEDHASGLAKLSNRQLGKLSAVQESYVGYVAAGQSVQGGGGGIGAGGGASALPQIQSGQGEVVVQLIVRYGLN
ncbi:MAG TPA: SIMPL domain-containing protein [Candidatus Dormibacteraeota bacterium]|nr:SIMPL domain-containing protein [Candidatus Dormibacteraeota bacterium]